MRLVIRSWLSSISSKVFFGLLTIVLLTLIAAGTAILTFNSFSSSFKAVAGPTISVLMTTDRLVWLSERLSSLAPDILATRNRFVRKSLSQEMAQLVHQKAETLADLKAVGVESALLDRLAVHFYMIVDNIDQLVALVNQRAECEKNIQEIILRLRRLGITINGLNWMIRWSTDGSVSVTRC